jgi:hypothetical protein
VGFLRNFHNGAKSITATQNKTTVMTTTVRVKSQVQCQTINKTKIGNPAYLRLYAVGIENGNGLNA